MEYQQLLGPLVEISEAAGSAILEIYNTCGDIEVQSKGDDSPLTRADLAAHHLIVDRLAALTPELPILSEESGEIPAEQRAGWTRYWLVDPLDGTKEFINRNGEFTVNIALIDQGAPVLGVVHVPVKGTTYTGVKGAGATCRDASGGLQPIQVRPLSPRLQSSQPVVVVGSRRHGADALDACIEKIRAEVGEVELTSMGSSLKICLVAAGEADLYPRLAPTCEWDTAAAQAVLEAAGGQVTDIHHQPLRYNQKAELLNPFFYCIGDPGFGWAAVLGAPEAD
ncbi:MAG: 3'(2'),5'-bisphosphate nucleotidase CysQ [Pseudomonadota bacterium]|nr:3'(2'),5'-bisphosphate nucleotidase CysQ [Pseudomonadota bacterium]